MANCYRCGKKIESDQRALRRKVKTGEWIRRGYGKNRIHAVQSHFGQRIVCRACARSIDIEERRIEWIASIKLVVALVVLFSIIAYEALQRR